MPDDEDWTALEQEVAELEAEAADDPFGDTLDALRAELAAEVAQTWRMALQADPAGTVAALSATADEAGDPVALDAARLVLAEVIEQAAAEEGCDAATMIARRRLPGVLDSLAAFVADAMASQPVCICGDASREHQAERLAMTARFALEQWADEEDLAVLRLALPAGDAPGTMLELTAALGGQMPAIPPASRPRGLPHSLNDPRHRAHTFGAQRSRLLGHATAPGRPVPPERDPARVARGRRRGRKRR